MAPSAQQFMYAPFDPFSHATMQEGIHLEVPPLPQTKLLASASMSGAPSPKQKGGLLFVLRFDLKEGYGLVQGGAAFFDLAGQF